MDIVGTFIGVNSLKVLSMSYYVIFIDNTVSAEHISGFTSNCKSFTTVVTLNN